MTLVLLKTDSHIAFPSDGMYNPYFSSASENAIPELYDIPIGIVNRVLYHEAHERAYDCVKSSNVH